LNKKFTQEDLADKAGLHPNYIGLIEREKRNVSVLALSKIAKALGVKITFLLE
jgi:transcriptional regulator with XRE-family HTH domain